MGNLLDIVSDKETSEFYPTPEPLAERMLANIDFYKVRTILEPSAGKGDILRVLAKKLDCYYGSRDCDIDCIELDPNLRAILKYNFSEFANGLNIIHDDFLTYRPFKEYDLIIMNPPFSNGDKHLLKALKIQKRGGDIVCLLNAETIRNPYTETRKELVKQLDQYGASIEFISNGFTVAERKTCVDVALIRVHIEAVQEESDIYNRMKAAEQIDEVPEDVTDLEVTDFIKAIVNQFNIEAKSGIELIRQYKNLAPYILVNVPKKGEEKGGPILNLKVCNKSDATVNEYMEKLRLKYWEALLADPKFMGKLTSKLQEEYRRRVDKLKNYDFTEFNIYTLSAEMNARIKTGIEDEIIIMFDRLTEEHSWYPETRKNRHYYDGWCANKAHKIGKKVILPCYGIFSSWDGRPRVYEAEHVLVDIEKILNYFDGHMTRPVNLWKTLDAAFKSGQTKDIELQFFKATFYKKGTVHLTFTNPELIERFNIYAAQNKKWLPPCYGRKSYQEMNDKEKAVIDSFQGEAAYEEVMKNKKYYLGSVTGNMQLLNAEH